MKKESILNKTEWLEAIEQMKTWMSGKQRAFSLCPYFIHPIRTAALVAKYKKSHEINYIVIAAIMHDIVEDTKITLDTIREMYGELVASLVAELTSDSEMIKQIGKTAYLCYKLANLSSWALVIKLCDRLDNVSDFSFAPKEFVEKYAKETLTILNYLELNRDLSDTHKEIIKDIRATVNIYWKAA